MLMQWLPKMKNLNPEANFHSTEAAQKALECLQWVEISQ